MVWRREEKAEEKISSQGFKGGLVGMVNVEQNQ